ncbi:hypothetical protein ACP70R_036234 [Stipagrostis hirtigluma subsp. patula]
MSSGHCHGNGGYGYGHQPQPTMHYHRTSTEHVAKVADTPACHAAAKQQHGACGGAAHNVGIHGYGYGGAQRNETSGVRDYGYGGAQRNETSGVRGYGYGGAQCNETSGVRGGYGFGEAQRHETYEETCEEYETTAYKETSCYEVNETCEEVGGGDCLQLRRPYPAC